jgi:hypothetical protein
MEIINVLRKMYHMHAIFGYAQKEESIGTNEFRGEFFGAEKVPARASNIRITDLILE